MKKALYFLPPILTLAAGMYLGISIRDLGGVLVLALGLALPMLISGGLLAKGRRWGALPGIAFGVWLAFQQSDILNFFWPGAVIAAFYLVCGLLRPGCLAWAKRRKKLLGWCAGILLAGVLAWLCDAMMGNPVSYLLAKKTAEQYLAGHYPGSGFLVEDFGYDFKDGGYYAHIRSPESPDTRFSIMMDRFGKFRWDSFEDRVTSRWNTCLRLEQEYSNRVKAAFWEDFPYEVELCSGSLEMTGRAELENAPVQQGLDGGFCMEDLQLDHPLDALPKTVLEAGTVTVWLKADRPDPALAARMLLEIRKTLDERQVPFGKVDFVQRVPEGEGGEITVRGILRDEIEPENLLNKIKEENT